MLFAEFNFVLLDQKRENKFHEIFVNKVILKKRANSFETH